MKIYFIIATGEEKLQHPAQKKPVTHTLEINESIMHGVQCKVRGSFKTKRFTQLSTESFFTDKAVRNMGTFICALLVCDSIFTHCALMHNRHKKFLPFMGTEAMTSDIEDAWLIYCPGVLPVAQTDLDK